MEHGLGIEKILCHRLLDTTFTPLRSLPDCRQAGKRGLNFILRNRSFIFSSFVTAFSIHLRFTTALEVRFEM